MAPSISSTTDCRPMGYDPTMLSRLIPALFAGMLLFGCSSTYKAERPSAQLAPRLMGTQCSFYVSVPEDGAYAGQKQLGSGTRTAQAIVAAFLPYVARAEQSASPESHEVAMAHAAANKFTHCVETTILNWEERATEWSGKPDVVSIRIVLYDVSSKTQIDSIDINGKSKWATLGGDHPQDLLPTPLKQYAAELFGTPAMVP